MTSIPNTTVTQRASNKTPKRMDDFSERTRTFSKFVAAWDKPELPDINPIIRTSMTQLIRELDALAPPAVKRAANVHHLKKAPASACGVIDGTISLTAVLDKRKETYPVIDGNKAQEEPTTTHNKRMFDAITGLLYGMSKAIYPLDSPLPESHSHRERDNEHYKIICRFVEAAQEDQRSAGSIARSFTHLMGYAEKAKHFVALVELRDAMRDIRSDGADENQATATLTRRLRQFNIDFPRRNEFETPAVATAIDAISAEPTNQNVREAIGVLSKYTHKFMGTFKEGLNTAYRADRKTLGSDHPALLQTSPMLDIVYDMRWAKAADIIYQRIEKYTAVLKYAMPLPVTSHQTALGAAGPASAPKR